MRGPGESRHFDKAHWVASKITGQALQQARHIAAGLAATRGWNTRIITETGGRWPSSWPITPPAT